MVRNKARLVAQGYTQEGGIDYNEVFASVARIKVIRLFLAYASFKDFVVYQMDVKSAFLYGKIEEEVYVCQPSGFEDLEFTDRVYKVEKALYGLHQAPIAWYETLSTYLLDIGFHRGLQGRRCVLNDGIFISQDKYVDEILKKFGFLTVKTASTPMETSKPLMKDENDEDVDVHLYRSMIGSLMYLTSSRPDIMFVVCACAIFQVSPKVSHLHAVKKIFRYLKSQPKLGLWYPKDSLFDLEAYTDSDYADAIAISTTEGEYIAASNCCGQVLWIQNQMLDYGYNFMNTKIFIDNENTICIVKNPMFHSNTKHIEIRDHFIRDSYEKRLIQVIKIHTDYNVADLLTKAFDIDDWNGLEILFDEIKVYIGNSKVNAVGRKVSAAKQKVNAARLNEDVHEERRDSVEKAATTAASLEAEHDSGNINRTQSMAIPNVPFPQGISSGGSPRCQEAIGDTIAQTRSKRKRVKKLERKNKSRTPQPKRRVYKPRVESSEKSLGEKNSSKKGRNSDKTKELNVAEDEHMFDLSNLAGTKVIVYQEKPTELVEDKGSAEKGVSVAEDKDSTADPVTTADDVTLAETLMAIRKSASRPQKLKGVVFKEPSEQTTTTSRPQPQIPAKDKGKGIMQEHKKLVKVKDKNQIAYDADVAQTLQAELDKEARLEREREEEASNAALIKE
ncbi:putative ribonuclease H-like domain-containing protein [Tanacetum coccineum]